MKIEQSQQGTVLVLTPAGALVDNDRTQLAELLTKHLERGDIKIIVDMNAVLFIESEGLEMLLDTAENAAAAGGGLRIASPSDTVGEILAATRLNTRIEVHKQLADARRSLL